MQQTVFFSPSCLVNKLFKGHILLRNKESQLLFWWNDVFFTFQAYKVLKMQRVTVLTKLKGCDWLLLHSPQVTWCQETNKNYAIVTKWFTRARRSLMSKRQKLMMTLVQNTWENLKKIHEKTRERNASKNWSLWTVKTHLQSDLNACFV